MSAILKFNLKKQNKTKQNNYILSEENDLNYTKKTQFCMWQLHFP